MHPEGMYFDTTKVVWGSRIQPSFDLLMAIEVKVAGLPNKQHFSLNPGGEGPVRI